LIRALEPQEGVEIMQRQRKANSLNKLTSGPGMLAKALAITKELNGIDVTERSSELFIVEGVMEKIQICSSHRIGVKIDLPQDLRFFIMRNKFVSKPRK